MPTTRPVMVLQMCNPTSDERFPLVIQRGCPANDDDCNCVQDDIRSCIRLT
jgi:hypothetical protein